MERNNKLMSIRRNVALKKRMHDDFTKSNLTESDIQAIRYKGEYWRKFKYSEILVRSSYDRNYPDNPTDFPGYYKAEIYNWYHNGLEVRTYPFVVKAVLKRLKSGADFDSKNSKDYDTAEFRLDTFGCIPFENIIEYDIDGDEYYNYPHLYCDYPCGEDPYEEIRYRTEDGNLVDSEDIVEII